MVRERSFFPIHWSLEEERLTDCQQRRKFFSSSFKLLFEPWSFWRERERERYVIRGCCEERGREKKILHPDSDWRWRRMVRNEKKRRSLDKEEVEVDGKEGVLNRE